MRVGPLIRVNWCRGDPTAVASIVALAEPAKAIDLTRSKVAAPSDEIEDLRDKQRAGDSPESCYGKFKGVASTK